MHTTDPQRTPSLPSAAPAAEPSVAELVEQLAALAGTILKRRDLATLEGRVALAGLARDRRLARLVLQARIVDAAIAATIPEGAKS